MNKSPVKLASVVALLVVCTWMASGLFMVVTTIGCASLGGSDPVVVRAEDALTNSFVLYRVVMEYHRKNSTTEPPDVYKSLEIIRKGFPKVWRSLHAAIPAYKDTKSAVDRKRLDEALLALETLTRQLRDIWAWGLNAGVNNAN